MNDEMSLRQAKKSIAVLPFVNMSRDIENEYFSDGITEEIINALTKVKGLKVIARTSSFAFKGKNIDVRDIGKQLGVSTILEGSVRKVENRVRITAQLINAEDGSHLWSKNFNREIEDIFVLQDEISLLIADQIRENFGHIEIPTFPHYVPTENLKAYDLWLKGSYHLKRKGFEDIKKSIEFLREAISVDSQYAEAHSMLGEAYLHAGGFGMYTTKEAHQLSREAARKAIEIDAENARAYKVLAYIHFFHDWNWQAAIDSYNTAIECGLAHQNEFITYYYIFIDEDFDRAVAVAEELTQTDPLHVITHWQLGLTYYFTRRFKEAIGAFNKALEIDGNFAEALRFRGLVKGCLGKYEQALTDINKALEFTSGQGLAQIDKLMVKIMMGKKKEALETIQKSDFVDSSDTAALYSLLNMKDEAFHWIEKALEERSVMMATLKNFWLWDNLREDERFQEYFDRLNFPDSTKPKKYLERVDIKSSDVAMSGLLSEGEVERYLHKLDHLLVTDEIYTDPALSLRKLAEMIDLHPNKLSWLLNEEIGKNYNEYINTFRLEKFKIKALNPKNSHLTLLGLAYESGFNSKTVFNAFFKKSEAMTPRAWVKNQTK